MNDKLAIVFPGQGSQSLGMLSGLAATHTIVLDTFSEASDSLGFDLWALLQAESADELNKTENTQPAMLAAGVAVWRVLQGQQAIAPAMMAGHSLGEYTALVCSGAMNFSDAVKLVRNRGMYMQQAVPQGTGAMAAILGLDDDVVRELCAESAQQQVVEAVNFNSPGQVVIAGDKDAVARAMENAKARGAKRALPLPVSVPSHCALMKPAAEKLAQELANITITMPDIKVLHNVSVESAVDSDSIKSLLAEQLYRPVRWVETVQKMKLSGVELLLEAGPGKVLTGLTKRIDKQLSCLPVLDDATLATALEKINA